MTEKKEDKPEAKKSYELVRVPTGEAIAIQTPSGEVLTTEQALVEILNKLDKVEKAVA